jgi:hypothetical protein
MTPPAISGVVDLPDYDPCHPGRDPGAHLTPFLLATKPPHGATRWTFDA